ncbi:protein rhomboid isoform X1 [Drosophila virilis]|uniref:protein rhomboid isoform X1 n=1 Tax=Drosophila virilis TaxID=7244 RepID=UPI001395CAAF|nr:protein rhomboid isoform X1 [Drosophila virilis]XP_032291071.1 protein rhomboid isoform X1 [Drosophila virilis]
MLAATVLQMPPSRARNSGLVLGVCLDQLMQQQPRSAPIGSKMLPAGAETEAASEKQPQLTGRQTRCWPPPCFMLLVSLLEILVFVFWGSAPPEDSLLIYRPDRRLQLWRFVSYALLHASWLHLGFNVLTQLLYGLPLELLHGSGRTAVVYVAGVLAGSLGTSVVDSTVYLVGASGGVYALLAAQLANVLLNFGHMRQGLAQLLAVVIFVSCDLAYTLYCRQLALVELPPTISVSYIAHMTGALAGLSLGLCLLRQLDGSLRPRLLRWLALGVWTTFSGFALAFNLINTVTAQLLAEQEGEDNVLKSKRTWFGRQLNPSKCAQRTRQERRRRRKNSSYSYITIILCKCQKGVQANSIAKRARLTPETLINTSNNAAFDNRQHPI